MVKETPYKETFRLEATELLNDMEEALLNMEKFPNDKTSVHRLFRSMHTIKGSGLMFGFEEIAEMAHRGETLLDKVREGFTPVTSELVDLFFTAIDQMKYMLNANKVGKTVDRAACEEIMDNMNRMMTESESGDSPHLHPTGEKNTFVQAENVSFFNVNFRPDPNILFSGLDPIRILDDLRGLGRCEIKINKENVPSLEVLKPEEMYFFWEITLTTNSGLNSVKDIFLFVEDNSQISIKELKSCSENSRSDDTSGEVSLKSSDECKPNLVECEGVTEKDLKRTVNGKEITAPSISETSASSIRIPSEKLEKLINLVGEILVTQAYMHHLAEQYDNAIFSTPIKQLERLTGELRELSLDMRMLPVGTLFGRFKRLVRDLSSRLEKDVDLVLQGGETEIDKTILEKMHDPLVHMIRNSIDHSIETPVEREKKGKPSKGIISLAAYQSGARVHITLADDGRGVNTDLVRKKAIERHLITEEIRLSEAEIHELIFTPGFSTADEVTSFSGRGVGMDVVKQEINSLGGNVEIKSIQGQGAMFHLSLPLTLAIIEGLHVKLNGRDFIIPVMQVEMCGELKDSPGEKDDYQHMMRLKDNFIPFIRLYDFFNIERHKKHSVEHLAAIRSEHLIIGVVVDEIVGNIQTVIKPLDPIYRNAEGVSGATVMGDGKIALIIDMQELVRCVKKDKFPSRTSL